MKQFLTNYKYSLNIENTEIIKILDILTPYSSILNTDSIGRWLLKKNKHYN